MALKFRTGDAERVCSQLSAEKLLLLERPWGGLVPVGAGLSTRHQPPRQPHQQALLPGQRHSAVAHTVHVPPVMGGVVA